MNISWVDIGSLTMKEEVCGDQSNLALALILISAIRLQRWDRHFDLPDFAQYVIMKRSLFLEHRP